MWGTHQRSPPALRLKDLAHFEGARFWLRVTVRTDGIKDLSVARQLARLAAAENERLHSKLEAQSRRIEELTCEDGDQQLGRELLRIEEQMAALQQRMFAASSEKRPRDRADAPVPTSPQPPTGARPQRDFSIDAQVHALGDEERCCES